MSARKLLNRWLAKYGYEIAKISRFRIILQKEVSAHDDFFFVQIGANDGVRFDDLYGVVTKYDCSGVVVEPLAYYFNKLEDNYRQYPNVRAIRCAICSGHDEVEMFHVDPVCLDALPETARGLGSMDREHLIREGIPPNCVMSEKVECIHLMDLIGRYAVPKLNLLQIDTEGYDAEVIKMLDFDVVKPNIIKYERKHLSKLDQKQVVRILRAEGYKVFKERSDNVAVLR